MEVIIAIGALLAIAAAIWIVRSSEAGTGGAGIGGGREPRNPNEDQR
jgi:hypothetical protein